MPLRCRVEATRQLTETPAEAEERATILFHELDADGGGTLDAEEIQLMSTRLGAPLNKRELKAAMEAMDADGGGDVDLAEFLAWWQESRTKPSKLALAVQQRWSNEGLELLRRARAAFEKHDGRAAQSAECELQIGIILQDRRGDDDAAEAVAAFRRSQVHYTAHRHPREFAIIQHRIALLHERLGRAGESTRGFQEALSLLDRSKDGDAWAAARNRLSISHWEAWSKKQ